MKIRRVVAYRQYFADFLASLSPKMQLKVFKSIEYIETQQFVPEKYLKHLEGTGGLYEIRARLSSDIVRVFCFFDGEKLVITLTGFVKKTQKTPKGEIELSIRLMKEYYKEKNA